MRNINRDLQMIWFTLIIFLAMFVGTAGGVLAWLSDHDVPAAVLYGGGSFATTIGLGLTAVHFMRDPATRP